MTGWRCGVEIPGSGSGAGSSHAQEDTDGEYAIALPPTPGEGTLLPYHDIGPAKRYNGLTAGGTPCFRQPVRSWRDGGPASASPVT